jgi:hypothetical protein
MKIIKWDCGNYGVRIGNWFTGYYFIDDTLVTWRYVLCHCKLKSYEKALNVSLRYKNKYETEESRGYKVLK